jgi:hypothetical protein
MAGGLGFKSHGQEFTRFAGFKTSVDSFPEEKSSSEWLQIDYTTLCEFALHENRRM